MIEAGHFTGHRSRSTVALDGGTAAFPRELGPSSVRGTRQTEWTTTATQAFRVEWRPLASLGAITESWQRLAARALEPNIFYAPAFALAAAPVFGANVGALLVWSASEPDRLLGLLPARIARGRYGVPLSVLVGWTHPYAPFGVPLVDRDLAESVITAVLAHIAQEPGLPDLLLLPLVPTDGPFARALAAVLAARRGRIASFAQHGRALLAPARDRAGYLDRMLPSRKRKELRRQARRLADRDALSTVSAAEPPAVAAALDEFLALEARGWKGRAGTAAARNPDECAFMRQAVGALAAAGQARVDRLMLGEHTVAAAITLRNGPVAWFWKIAYDEDLARASPGVQLVLDLTPSLLGDPGLVRVDSCATPDHPMIDHLWRERLLLADELIAVGPAGTARFAVACLLETLRRASVDAAKRVRQRLRRR